MPHRSISFRRGFTLVELLVVIGIIAVLVSLPLPSLNRARAQAQSIQCLSNLKQIGLAFNMYLAESKGWFPTQVGWGTLMGKKGRTDAYEAGTGLYTGFEGEAGIVGVRKLNPYLKTPDVLHCPSDIGDTLSPVNSPDPCFEMYGTSYIVHYFSDAFFLAAVTAPGTPGQPKPMKIGGTRGVDPTTGLVQPTFKDMSNKIIAGDWNLHSNRVKTFERTMWHHKAKPNQPRRHNILFGDFHAEDYQFKLAYEDANLNPPTSWFLPLDPLKYGVW